MSSSTVNSNDDGCMDDKIIILFWKKLLKKIQNKHFAVSTFFPHTESDHRVTVTDSV